MTKCRHCGKESDDLDENGLCPDCADEEKREMDDFATMIINSPFNPGL